MLPSQRAFRGVLFGHCPSQWTVVTLLFASLAIVALSGCGGGVENAQPTPPNPQPTITSLSPSVSLVGSGSRTLTINGSNFLSSSTVDFAGSPHTPTFVNSGQLTVSLTSADQATVGTYPVVVSNPAPGGGQSNSVNFAVNNPQPALSSISPSVLAAGSPDTTITLIGTNFVTTSSVNLNGTPLTTTFLSSIQLTATIPSSSLTGKATSQITVSSPSPGGGSSSPQVLSVVAVGSFVITATPATGGQGNETWLLSVGAVDSQGARVAGLPVSLSTSSGTLSQLQGITDAAGTFSASVSPPASYSGQAVAVSATTGSQTASINIAFVPSIFSPSSTTAVKDVRYAQNSSGTGVVLNSPFLMGISGPPGTDNPFVSQPSLCYSNVDLTTTLSADCQSLFNGQGVQQGILNVANTVCNAGTTVTDIVGAAACVGIAATVVSCAFAETGVGAVICAGGLEYSGLLSDACLAALTNILAEYLLKNPTDVAAVDVIGIQPGPPSLGGEIGLVCDAVTAASIGSGSGSSGTTVSISPTRPIAVLGSNVGFTSLVTGASNTAVAWSVNGVTGGSGPFGVVDNNGVYTAPSSMPPFNLVSVTATSASDATASASAVVQLVVNLPGTIVTVAGNGTAGHQGDGGPAISAELFVPTGVAFDGGGNMFIADYSNNVIRRVDAATGFITTIAGTGVVGYSGDNGPATNAQLNGPTHVVFDRTTNLYITDANNNRIRKVDVGTGVITTVAGTGTAGFSGDGGPGTNAELNFPDGVALDAAQNLYIGDARNNRIRKLDVSTRVITTVAGSGTAGYAGDGGLATNAELNFPSRPTLDSNGNMYIADYQNNRVRRVDALTNTITTVAGTGIAGFSGDGGPAASAELNGPISVTLDGVGNLYIGDISNERIRVVNMTTNSVTLLGLTLQPGEIGTAAGNGSAGYSGDGGPAVSAQLNFPTGLLIDTQGNLYLADANNNVVRRVTGQLQ
jgi:hypothetical protein